MTSLERAIQEVQIAVVKLKSKAPGSTLLAAFDGDLESLSNSLPAIRKAFLDAGANAKRRHGAIRSLALLKDSLEKRHAAICSRREEYGSDFETFDQKANQMFSILTTIVKAKREMDVISAINRNIL